MQSKRERNRRRKSIALKGVRPPFKGKRDYPQYVGAYRLPASRCCIYKEPLANSGSEIDVDISRTSRKTIRANLPATGNQGTRVKSSSRTRIRVRNRSVHGESVSNGSVGPLRSLNIGTDGTSKFTGYVVRDDVRSGAGRPKHHKRHTQCIASQPHSCLGIASPTQ